MSGLPVPVFYDQPTFSTKKQQSHISKRCVQHRPKSPKTAPEQVRPFGRRHAVSNTPHVVSFKHSNQSSSLQQLHNTEQTSTALDDDGSCLRSKLYDTQRRDELYIDQCFVVEEKIGEGSFGEVFRARSKENGRLYAVKRALEQFRSMADRSRKLAEVQKHETLKPHPNLVSFVVAWEERSRLYIQTELCRSSLKDYADKYHDSIPERKLWLFLVDLLQAIAHLHKHNLVHMDVKPENIFLADSPIEYLKLGDFGLVVDLKLGEGDGAVEEGDSRYLAPEMLSFGAHCTKAVDIFSLGVTMLELASDLDTPNSGSGWELLRMGRVPVVMAPFLKNRSRAFVSTIASMMAPNPKDRPSAEHLLQTPALRSVQKQRAIQLFFAHFVCLFQSCLTVLYLYVYVLHSCIRDAFRTIIRPHSSLVSAIHTPITARRNESINSSCSFALPPVRLAKTMPAYGPARREQQPENILPPPPRMPNLDSFSDDDNDHLLHDVSSIHDSQTSSTEDDDDSPSKGVLRNSMGMRASPFTAVRRVQPWKSSTPMQTRSAAALTVDQEAKRRRMSEMNDAMYQRQRHPLASNPPKHPMTIRNGNLSHNARQHVRFSDDEEDFPHENIMSQVSPKKLLDEFDDDLSGEDVSEGVYLDGSSPSPARVSPPSARRRRR